MNENIFDQLLNEYFSYLEISFYIFDMNIFEITNNIFICSNLYEILLIV